MVEAGVFGGELFVDFFQFEIVFYGVVPLAERAGPVARDAHKSRFMVFVVTEKKGKGSDLQHQKKQEVGVFSDEEKNIAHRWYDLLSVTWIYILAHHKRIPVIILQ